MNNTIKIVERPELKTSDLLNLCRVKFPVWCSEENEELDKQFPAPKKATVRHFRDRVEADEELKNKSANDLEKEGIEGITVRERIIMELEYFERTGGHLDIDNITLCSGSRSRYGIVPIAYWHGGKFHVSVDWYGLGNASGSLRGRQVVSSDVPLKSETCSLNSDLERRVKILEDKLSKIAEILK